MSKHLSGVVFASFVLLSSLTTGSCLATDGPIGLWKFIEGDGNVVKDSSGKDNQGTIVPTNTRTSKWGEGEFAGSASFSGDNDHFVRIPASASLNNIRKQLSVVAFVYPRTLSTSRDWLYSKFRLKLRNAIHFVGNLVGMPSQSVPGEEPSSTGFIAIVQRQWRQTIHPDQYYLGYGPKDNALHYKWHIGLMDGMAELYRLPKGQDKPELGKWVHLAGTYNGDTGKMSLYVDGELIGTQTRPGEIRLDGESLNRPLAIGAELNGPSMDESTGEFDGYIREVRIYDRALSHEEIKLLAQEAKEQISKTRR